MAFTVKTFDQIMEDWVAYTVANASSITDMSPGSVIRSFCEGGSLAIEELYVATYLGFRRYLDSVPETVFDFDKKQGTYSTVGVVFTREGSSGLITIPAGTRLNTPSGLRFILDSDTIIADGNTDSASSEVTGEKVGSAYNVSTGSITILEDQVSGTVLTVTNPLAATGGVDTESALSYSNRFQAYIEGLGRSNIAGLSAGVLSVDGITSVSVVELFPAISNVNVYVYVDDGSTVGISAELVQSAQDVIDGDGTESNPGYRAAGVNVVVQAPAIQTQDVDVTIEIIAGVDTDQVESDIIDAVTQYINNLGVGSDIVYNEIVSSIMGVYGIADCDITDPVDNAAVSDSQVGRLGTLTITQG